MNTIFKRYLRDNLEAHIVQNYRRIFPHFEMESQFMRIPTHPKIILYSNVASVDKFIEKLQIPNSASSPSSSSSTRIPPL